MTRMGMFVKDSTLSFPGSVSCLISEAISMSNGEHVLVESFINDPDLVFCFTAPLRVDADRIYGSKKEGDFK